MFRTDGTKRDDDDAWDAAMFNLFEKENSYVNVYDNQSWTSL